MSEDKLHQTHRKSRVLAALDSDAFLNPTTQFTPGSLGQGLPTVLQTPIKQRLETPAPIFDYPGLVGALGGGRKRKTSDDYDVSHPRTNPAAGLSRTEFSLRYDQESAVSRIDIGGHDQDQRMAEFVSRGIDNAAHGLTVQKAMEKLGLDDAMDLIPGMEVRLLPHQLVGVSWMIEQERESPHKGGILADDMGLGKTVQMIATMVLNQPTEENKHRSTLVVVPAALLLQWKEELDTKTNGMFDVHIQHGKDKIKKVDRLTKKDVVITTYQTLNLDLSIPSDIDSCDELDWLKENGGPMSRIRWYRVILDEAQFVRNRATRCSKAVAMLRTKYRWCLTGTPITNTLADIYGYLRFGRFRPFNDWESFNTYIAKMQLEDAPLAGMRAQEVLKPLLLRRTKDAKLDNGDPILQLPPKDVELVYVEFSQDERDLYNQFEKQAQIQINRFIRSNSLLKNHQQVFVLILRLRQVCTHPYLVLSEADEFNDPSLLIGSEGEKEQGRATRAMGAKWVANLKKRFLERALALESDLDDDAEDTTPVCPKCGDLFLEINGRVLACSHEICAECVEELGNSNIQHNGEFGNDDEKTNLQIEKDFEAAAAKGLRPCPTCQTMQDLRRNYVFLASAFLPSQNEVRAAMRAAQRRPSSPPVKKRKLEPIDINSSDSGSDDDMPDLTTLLRSSPNRASPNKSQMKKPVKGEGITKGQISDADMVNGDSDSNTLRKGKGKEKGKNEEPIGPEKPLGTDPNQYTMWKEGGTNVESSAKMIQMIAYLKEWEALGDKTIVFSQWTSMLDLCEQIFARHGVRSLRYDGKMSREAREYCLTEFRRAGSPKVVLISTRCGGVGLNLVSANRVINLDLAWNYATESQAYDRVHRLGQEKNVYIKRLVISDTIEERMLKLQDTKLGLAEAALGEGTGVRLNKLSVKQIKDLFGMNRLANKDGGGAASQDQ